MIIRTDYLDGCTILHLHETLRVWCDDSGAPPEGVQREVQNPSECSKKELLPELAPEHVY